MVRKIKNNAEKEKKTKVSKQKMTMKELMVRNNQIDQQINKSLEMVETSMGKEYADKLNRLTVMSANDKYIDRTLKLLLDLYHVYLVKKEIKKNGKQDINPEYIDDVNQMAIKKFFKEYEQEYYPKITTLFYTSFFNINKMIEKYFGVNEYKKRFTPENKGMFNIEEYKKMSFAIKTKSLVVDDIVFTGEWKRQIDKISHELDYILKVLNTYREEYIYMPKLNKIYIDTRKSINLENTQPEVITNGFQKLLHKTFKRYPDIINSYDTPIDVRYKYEYIFLIETMMYVALNENEENLKYLEENLYHINGSKQKTKLLMEQINQVNTNVHIFLKNFDKLVMCGDDHFDTTIKRAILEVI